MNERLKEIRKHHKCGKTQDMFADFLGISKSNLASYESGRRTPSEAVIHLICEKCDVNEKWLRTGEGEMFVELSRDEQISKFAGEILKNEEDSFKKRFISMLAALDESDWESLQKMVELLQKKEGLD